jgi:hypothetical protein
VQPKRGPQQKSVNLVQGNCADKYVTDNHNCAGQCDCALDRGAPSSKQKPETEYDSYGSTDLDNNGLDALTVPIPTFGDRGRSPEVGEGWLQLKQL